MIKIIKLHDYLGDGVYIMENDVANMEFTVNTRPGCYLNYDPKTDMVGCPWKREEVALTVILENYEREKKAGNVIENIHEAWSPEDTKEERK